MFFGLIGEKLSHSFSKEIHNFYGNYDYQLYPMKSEEILPFIQREDFGGTNVTIPYKKTVIPYCDELSSVAEKTRSVNTIVKRNGRIFGDNTDYYGFLYTANRSGISFTGKDVVVLGSGGTSATVVQAVTDGGAKSVTVVSRQGSVNYENIYETARDAEIIINTTPYGMYPNNTQQPLVNLSEFKRLSGVIDVIFNPARTALLALAVSMGIKTAGGLPMLAAQAKKSSELFTGAHIPDSKIEEIINIIEQKTQNIILCGMPGSGKTEIGKKLAYILKKDFIDTDAEIEKEAGIKIPEIFEKYGEDYFRNLESEIIRLAGKRTSCVISTGGGSVLREENRYALAQNGKVVFIKRPLNLLCREGRPLSSSTDALEKMYLTRLPVYEKFSDFSVDNDSTVKEAAEEILKKLNTQEQL